MGIETPPPVNGDFVNEGTFLALPPCFPGVSLPPPANETRAHRLFRSASGRDVFAATRGPVPHLLQFRPKGTFGYAVDLGTPMGATEITALLSDDARECPTLYVACTGADGASIHRCRPALMGPGTQEWHVHCHPFEMALTLPLGSIDGMVGSEAGIFAWGDKTGFFLSRQGADLMLEKNRRAGWNSCVDENRWCRSPTQP